MSGPAASTYDEMPYIDRAFAQSHPDRLATIAAVFGMRAASLERCRVLELGCASGGNLIPMALDLPEAQFVGIDLSQRQIDEGQRVVAALGLANLELRRHDIMDVDASFGTFDYVIAHGVYSWVPPPVREKVLAICRERLAPDGVAYVSYNTRPGWAGRGVIRDMMTFHTAAFPDAATKVAQARSLLQFMAESVPGKTYYGAMLGTELQGIRGKDDAYLFHDYLEEVNEAFYFHEFVAAAERHELQYLGEAVFGTMFPTNFPPRVVETLRRLGSDVLRMEQYLDFLRNRMFRQTLLVHRHRALDRNVTPRVIEAMHFTSAARFTNPTPSFAEGTGENFRLENGVTAGTSASIAKAAIAVLQETWPASIPFADLLANAQALLARAPSTRARPSDEAADRERLAAHLLSCHALEMVDIRSRPLRAVNHIAPRPLASPLARLQARRGPRVTNLRLDRVELDSFSRYVLPLLDGTRDRATLRTALADLVRDGEIELQVNKADVVAPDAPLDEILTRGLDESLATLRHTALLQG